MSVKDILKSLIRPVTSEELKEISDRDLKSALEKAADELKNRGWEIGVSGSFGGHITVKKTVKL